MYRNGKQQAKRITRKVAECAFDMEVLRNFLFEMDHESEAHWEESLMDLNDLLAEFTSARDLAQSALDAIKGTPATPTATSEQTANPFAPKHPQAVTGDKNAPKDKVKGG